MESFKHGALREQLANLAMRQKSLLAVAKKQKKIRLKIQNYKNATPSSVSLRKQPCSSDISSDRKSQEPPQIGNSAHTQSGSLAPVSLAYRSMQGIPLSPEIESFSQNTNICLNAEVIRREEFSGNDTNSKQNIQDCSLGGLLISKPPDNTENITASSQPTALTPQAENSQAENIFTENTVKGYGFDSSALAGTLNISEDKSVFSQNDACVPAVPQNQELSRCNPKRRNKKPASQQPSEGASEPPPQAIAVVDTLTVHQTMPCLKESASVASHAGSTTPRKKAVQLKDLILLGRIRPGNNILEFKTQVFFFLKVLHIL